MDWNLAGKRVGQKEKRSVALSVGLMVAWKDTCLAERLVAN